jgi:hypothetical protein
MPVEQPVIKATGEEGIFHPLFKRVQGAYFTTTNRKTFTGKAKKDRIESRRHSDRQPMLFGLTIGAGVESHPLKKGYSSRRFSCAVRSPPFSFA